MQLIENRYYKFTECGYKFWYKKLNYSEKELCSLEFLSFELTDKHPLKFVEKIERWGLEELWFEYYDSSTGETYLGEVGCFLKDRHGEGLSIFFTALTVQNFLPANLISDLKEVLEAVNNDQSKEFNGALNNYLIGSEEALSFRIGINEELEEDERDADAPELIFEILLHQDEFRLSLYLQDASWGEPYNVEITYEMQSPNIGSTDWKKEKELLMDRIKLYKSQLNFAVN